MIKVIDVVLVKDQQPMMKITFYGLDWEEIFNPRLGKIWPVLKARGLDHYQPSTALSFERKRIDMTASPRRRPPPRDYPPQPHPAPEPWVPPATPMPDGVKRRRRARAGA